MILKLLCFLLPFHSEPMSCLDMMNSIFMTACGYNRECTLFLALAEDIIFQWKPQWIKKKNSIFMTQQGQRKVEIPEIYICAYRRRWWQYREGSCDDKMILDGQQWKIICWLESNGERARMRQHKVQMMREESLLCWVYTIFLLIQKTTMSCSSREWDEITVKKPEGRRNFFNFSTSAQEWQARCIEWVLVNLRSNSTFCKKMIRRRREWQRHTLWNIVKHFICRIKEKQWATAVPLWKIIRFVHHIFLTKHRLDSRCAGGWMRWWTKWAGSCAREEWKTLRSSSTQKV